MPTTGQDINPTFRAVVIKAHRTDQYATALWDILKDKTRAEIIRPEQIPCVAWCMLEFDLPVSVVEYLSATKGE